jgi:hypothetical protein
LRRSNGARWKERIGKGLEAAEDAQKKYLSKKSLGGSPALIDLYQPGKRVKVNDPVAKDFENRDLSKLSRDLNKWQRSYAGDMDRGNRNRDANAIGSMVQEQEYRGRDLLTRETPPFSHVIISDDTARAAGLRNDSLRATPTADERNAAFWTGAPERQHDHVLVRDQRDLGKLRDHFMCTVDPRDDKNSKEAK